MYVWLQSEVQKRGLSSIEELLEIWQSEGDDTRQRWQVVQQIDALREELFAKYVEMPVQRSSRIDHR
jgi:hypothetical protein